LVNILKHIEYWRSGAEDALDTAERLVSQGKHYHGLFFAHLALEKLLKAHICKSTGDLAPMLHSLPRLAELTGTEINEDFLRILAKINEFNIAGRYPALLDLPPSSEDADRYRNEAREVFQWLMSRL